MSKFHVSLLVLSALCTLMPSEASARLFRRFQRSTPVTRHTTYYRPTADTETAIADAETAIAETATANAATTEAATNESATTEDAAATTTTPAATTAPTADASASTTAPTAEASASTNSLDVSTAQGVANIMAHYNRVGHWGGNPGYEGCGCGMTPEAAYNACCYSRSGMATVDVGYARGSNGMWYCCRRYR